MFDTKHMIISLLSEPSIINEKIFAEGYNVLTGKVDNHPANNKCRNTKYNPGSVF